MDQMNYPRSSACKKRAFSGRVRRWRAGAFEHLSNVACAGARQGSESAHAAAYALGSRACNPARTWHLCGEMGLGMTVAFAGRATTGTSMNASEFTEEQKLYLEGFAAGSGLR